MGSADSAIVAGKRRLAASKISGQVYLFALRKGYGRPVAALTGRRAISARYTCAGTGLAAAPKLLETT
jgi:hypothetical protein